MVGCEKQLGQREVWSKNKACIVHPVEGKYSSFLTCTCGHFRHAHYNEVGVCLKVECGCGLFVHDEEEEDGV